MKISYVRESADCVEYALTEEGEVTRYFRLDKNFYTDSVVRGKVKFVKRGVGIFIDIGLEKDGIMNYREGVKAGDFLTVQIKTEPKEDRGCELTEKISLQGKFLVYLAEKEIHYSKEIPTGKREELKKVSKPQRGGYIFRSLCTEGSMEEIENEGRKLEEKYNQITEQGKNLYKIAFLYRPTALQIAERSAVEISYDFQKIEGQISTIRDRKVVKNGVELVFDKTEAMTVVDVNFHCCDRTGKYAPLEANKIAVKEFARQIKLRNIGGIIVLDYIGVSATDGEELFDFIKKELACDFAQCQVEQAVQTGVFLVMRQGRFSSN